MRQLILDTETTGLNPEDGHRIIEFAAMEMIDRKLTGKYLQMYINPNRAIDPGATRVHGITDSDVQDKPQFAEVAQQIIDYIQDAELIIHNAKFDLNFLDFQFKLHGLDATSSFISGVVDTLILARQKFPGSKNNLDALCDRFNVDRSNRDFHGALIDCRLLADVYLGLTREQISLLGSNAQHKKSHSVKNFQRIDTSELNLKIEHPSPLEDEEHIKYFTPKMEVMDQRDAEGKPMGS